MVKTHNHRTAFGPSTGNESVDYVVVYYMVLDSYYYPVVQNLSSPQFYMYMHSQRYVAVLGL